MKRLRSDQGVKSKRLRSDQGVKSAKGSSDAISDYKLFITFPFIRVDEQSIIHPRRTIYTMQIFRIIIAKVDRKLRNFSRWPNVKHILYIITF